MTLIAADWFMQPWVWAQDAQQGPGAGSMMFPLIAIGFLFYFLLFRPEKQKQTAQREMLSSLKKDDRVVTYGGIYGIVTNVMQEADKVTLKVDEANNFKINVTLSSIARILSDKEDTASAKS